MATRPTLMLPLRHAPFARGILRGRWYRLVKGRMRGWCYAVRMVCVERVCERAR